jgi:hypothetical protein
MLQLRQSARDTLEIRAIQEGNKRSHRAGRTAGRRDSDEGNRNG